jgi:hypothetical protein
VRVHDLGFAHEGELRRRFQPDDPTLAQQCITVLLGLVL